VSIDTVNALAGSDVPVSVKLDPGDQSVFAIQQDIEINLPISVDRVVPGGAPDCTANASLGLTTALFACLNQPGCTRIRAVLQRFTGIPLPATTLYSCNYTVDPAAAVNIYPLTILALSVQNAVVPHQVGTATGVMNFFRALISALEVAILGAIVVAGFGVGVERGRGAEVVIQAANALGSDVSHVFGWMFATAGLFLALGAAALLLMEERPLRGPAAGT